MMPHSQYYFKIITNKFGKVVTVTKPIPKGQLLRAMNGPSLKEPTRTSIQWGTKVTLDIWKIILDDG